MSFIKYQHLERHDGQCTCVNVHNGELLSHYTTAKIKEIKPELF